MGGEKPSPGDILKKIFFSLSKCRSQKAKISTILHEPFILLCLFAWNAAVCFSFRKSTSEKIQLFLKKLFQVFEYQRVMLFFPICSIFVLQSFVVVFL